MTRQLWMTVGMIGVLGAVLVAQGLTPVMASSEWTAPSTILSIFALIYGVGMTIQQFRDHVRRLVELEYFRDHVVPMTYMRKDVFHARFQRRVIDDDENGLAG